MATRSPTLDTNGNERLAETHVCADGTNHERIAWTVRAFNDRGQATL
jgi:hypothetical protein